MRKLFQTEWHGIPFTTFAHLRSDRLPDEEFYQKFYRLLFDKYPKPSDLDKEWVKLKVGTINQLINHFPLNKSARILSLSCGLGLMELELIHQGYTGVEVTEISSEPLLWLRKDLPAERIHIGNIPSGNRYDWVLMSIVDYFYDEKGFPSFLSKAGNLLNNSGCCTLVCFPGEEKQSALDRFKYFIRDRYPHLEHFGLIKPAQFWGYSRTLDEYRVAIRQAEMILINEGNVDTNTRWPSYQLTFKRHRSPTE